MTESSYIFCKVKTELLRMRIALDKPMPSLKATMYLSPIKLISRDLVGNNYHFSYEEFYESFVRQNLESSQGKQPLNQRERKRKSSRDLVIDVQCFHNRKMMGK